jgi:hypothetical protein
MKLEKSYLEFIRRLDEFDNHHHRLSLYRCCCGKLIKRAPGHAKKVNSCGCLREKNIRLMGVRDYSNQFIGRFFISHLIEIRQGIKGAGVWAAVCLACKRNVQLSPYNITQNTSPCRCRHRKAIKKEAMRRAEIKRNVHFQLTGDQHE